MIPGFETQTPDVREIVPPGWHVQAVKIRVFNVADTADAAECGELMTQFAASTDSGGERLVPMSVAPRPVYSDDGKAYLDITWAVLRPVKKPHSDVVPVASDRRAASDAVAALRDSFGTPPSRPATAAKATALDLD